MIRAVDQAEAEQADFVVCMDAPAGTQPPAPGSERTTCSGCGKALWIHPTSPRTPPRICFTCAADIAERSKGPKS